MLPPCLPPPLLSQANPNAIIIKIAIPPSQNISNPCPNSPPPNDPTDSEDSDTEDMGTRRQFCPLDLQEKVRSLIEKHFCAHPSIPGYARPSEVGIRWWAVQEMYNFCVRNCLCELWAYLWGNWYCPERWTLWARSTCPEIPRLRTTMICESQYVFHFIFLLYSVISSLTLLKKLAAYQIRLSYPQSQAPRRLSYLDSDKATNANLRPTSHQATHLHWASPLSTRMAEGLQEGVEEMHCGPNY